MMNNELTINQLLNTLPPMERSHSIRVSIYANSFGRILGFNDHELKILSNTALMHDIGKTKISSKILDKKGKLNDIEFEHIKSHSVKSEEITSYIPGLKNYAYIVRAHHERWDGTGYPDGLQGQAIPLYSRIISIVDVYDALTTNRPYRDKIFTTKEALKILVDGMGSQFDAALVKMLVANSNEVLRLNDVSYRLKLAVNASAQK